LLSSLRFSEPGLLGRLRRFDVERRLALVLAVLAVISSIATYAVIQAKPPYGGSVQTVLVLLNLDLVLLLLLGLVVARRLVRVVLERRRGHAGSRLHGQLIMLFAVLAAAPAMVVSIFSVLFLSSGLETWFSDRVRTALDNSLAVAEAYLEEHKENIRADALAMAADLNREGTYLLADEGRLQQFVNNQAAIRDLTEAIVFDSTGMVLARTGLSFGLEIERLPHNILREAAEGNAVTVTSDSDDRVRALVRLDGFGDAYLFVGRFVDASVLAYMQRTQNVVSDYRRMESERWGIQLTSALLFAVVALLLLLASVWIGLNFADRLVQPISQLIAAANRVRSGDLMARVPEPPGEDEIGVLSRAFNRMTSQLSSQRRELIEANQQLDERRRFSEAVLAGVTGGVIGLDADRRIVFPNRAAIDFLAPDRDDLAGLPIESVLPEAAPLFQRLDGSHAPSVEQQITVHRGDSDSTLLLRLSVQTSGGTVSGYVVTFDDITDLLSAQRQAAWAEVARRIAHEIKNPLTPIRLSAERLNRKYKKQITQDEEQFSNAVQTIIRQVDTIGRMIGEFSAFARMPAPVMREEKLPELVHHAVSLERSARPDIAFETALPAEPIRLVCDGEKVTQALTNLLQNAVQALSEAGQSGAAQAVAAQAETVQAGTAPERAGPQRADRGGAAPGRIVVRARQEGGRIEVEVEDNGPGLPPGERQRLLEPYVTNRAKGTGLGLAIVHKIMEEHQGRVELDSGEFGGACVRLVFPPPTVA